MYCRKRLGQTLRIKYGVGNVVYYSWRRLLKLFHPCDLPGFLEVKSKSNDVSGLWCLQAILVVSCCIC